MYTVTKRFVQSCYACFLSHKGSRKQKLGIYPTPSRPFAEITVDLAENLGKSAGYNNLLVCQCTFSDFTILVPLKSKTSEEVTRAMMNSVLMQYNVEVIHSDNGPCFRSAEWLRLMASLKIKVTNTASLHPAGRGKVERLVGLVKLLLRKMIATKTDLHWEHLPYLVAKIYNNSISPSTGFKPSAMVYGEEGAGPLFLDADKTVPAHHFVHSQQSHIDKTTATIKDMVAEATEKITQMRICTNEKENASRTHKVFKPGDYVFVLDRTIVPGSPRVLRTKLLPSPYVVLKPLFTTTLVRRLADGFTGLYSNSDLKLYAGNNPIFQSIPAEVNKVLLHKFADLLSTDFTTITKHDLFPIPSAIPLFDPNIDDTLPLMKDDEELKLLPDWSFNDEAANPMNVVDEVALENDTDDAVENADENVDPNQPRALTNEPDVSQDLQMLTNENDPAIIDDEFAPNIEPQNDDDDDDDEEKGVTFANEPPEPANE
jgi:hypothetical protein